jgi:hypothetical protein
VLNNLKERTMSKSTRRYTGIAATLAMAVGGAVGLAGSASAGHLNTVLNNQLNGRNQVAADGSNTFVGDRDGRGEAYVFGIDGDLTTLCYIVTASKIDLTFVAGQTGAAHIHRGVKGTNGPVVANLAFPVGGDAADCLTEGEAGKFPRLGMAGEPASIVQDILANPAGYYVNVHTVDFPAGAIRGQLAPIKVGSHHGHSHDGDSGDGHSHDGDSGDGHSHDGDYHG